MEDTVNVAAEISEITSKHIEKVYHIDDFEKIADQKGSNPGGVYRHKTTKEHFYLKFPAQQHTQYGSDIAKNEVLAARLYALAGVKVPEVFLIEEKNGQLGVASKMELSFKEARDPERVGLRTDVNWPMLTGIQEGFVVDAWLANWDVVGLLYDNIGTYINKDNQQVEAFRLDTGGALLFRAQGTPKEHVSFTAEVIELDTLRDPKRNPQAAILFKDISEEKIEQGITNLWKISDDAIKNSIERYAPDSPLPKEQLCTILIARKENLGKRLRFNHLWRNDAFAELAKLIEKGPHVTQYCKRGPLNKNEATKQFEELIKAIIKDQKDKKSNSKKLVSIAINQQVTNDNQSTETVSIIYQGKKQSLHDLINQVNFTHLSFSAETIETYSDILIQQEYEQMQHFKNKVHALLLPKLAPFLRYYDWISLPDKFSKSFTRITQTLAKIDVLTTYCNHFLCNANALPNLKAYLLGSLAEQSLFPCIFSSDDILPRVFILDPIVRRSLTEGNLPGNVSLSSEEEQLLEAMIAKMQQLNFPEAVVRFKALYGALMALDNYITKHSFIPPYRRFQFTIGAMPVEEQDKYNGLHYGEMVAIYKYSSFTYTEINALLRNKAMNIDRDTLPLLLLNIAFAAYALNKVPMSLLPDKEASCVIRGQLNYNLDSLKSYAQNHTITVDKAFISTSFTAKNYFIKEQDDTIKIIYKGIRGVDITPLSKFAHEKEYLIPPSTQIKWTGYTKNHKGDIFTAEGITIPLKEQVALAWEALVQVTEWFKPIARALKMSPAGSDRLILEGYGKKVLEISQAYHLALDNVAQCYYDYIQEATNAQGSIENKIDTLLRKILAAMFIESPAVYVTSHWEEVD